MLDELVDGDVVLRVGVFEELLLVGVGIRRVHITVLAQTVRRTVLQHVDDTAGAHVLTSGTLVAAEGELRVELEGELVVDLDVGFHVQVGAAHARAENDTLVLRLCQRDVELHLLRAAADVDVGGVVDGSLAHHLVLPVVGGQRAVHIKVVGVAEVGLEELRVAGARTVAGVPLVLVFGKVGSVHQVERLRDVADAEAAVERHLHGALLGALRGDDDYTVTTLGTVDGRQRGIFQDINRGDVRRGNIVDVVHLETVDDVERRVRLRHRGAATNADVYIGTGLTVNRRHLHTGNLTLQGYGSRRHRHDLQLGSADGAD